MASLQVYRWIDVQQRIAGILCAIYVAGNYSPEGLRALLAVALAVGIQPQAEIIRQLQEGQRMIEEGDCGTTT